MRPVAHQDKVKIAQPDIKIDNHYFLAELRKCSTERGCGGGLSNPSFA